MKKLKQSLKVGGNESLSFFDSQAAHFPLDVPLKVPSDKTGLQRVNPAEVCAFSTRVCLHGYAFSCILLGKRRILMPSNVDYEAVVGAQNLRE